MVNSFLNKPWSVCYNMSMLLVFAVKGEMLELEFGHNVSVRLDRIKTMVDSGWETFSAQVLSSVISQAIVCSHFLIRNTLNVNQTVHSTTSCIYIYINKYTVVINRIL